MKKQNNNQHDTILYHHPASLSTRATRRGYRSLNFNDRSPEYRAMKAHLRASAYDKYRRSKEPRLALASGGGVAGQSVPTLVELLRAYGEQASRNFLRDGILLALFGALSAWAIIHAIQAMAG